MAFDGTEGAAISILDAAPLTKNYRDANPGAVKATFIGKEHIQDLLDQTNCKGIRVYFGLSSTGEMETIWVGADTHENDILDLIIDNAIKCPVRCGTKNKLNTD